MSQTTYSPIVELRMYTLHPGRRDELIRLFERELQYGTLVAPFPHVLKGPGSYWLLWKKGGLTPHFADWLISYLGTELDRRLA